MGTVPLSGPGDGNASIKAEACEKPSVCLGLVSRPQEPALGKNSIRLSL